MLLILGTVGCDQAAKSIARASLPLSLPVPIGRLATLFLTENTGAFLSVGSELPDAVRFWVLGVVLSLALLIGLLYLAASEISERTRMAAALVAGGGVSNGLDRLLHAGRVTDFLVLHLGALRTGVFNLADVAISTGVGLLGFALWRRSRTAPLSERTSAKNRRGRAS